MNPAFQLPKDKDSREDDSFRSFLRVSLWEMLRFYADIIIKIFNQLTFIENFIEITAPYAPGPITLSRFPPELQEPLNTVPSGMEYLGLNISKEHTKALVDYLNDEETLDAQTLKSLTHAVRWSLIYELKDKLLLMSPVRCAEYYDMEYTFLGESVLMKFPDLEEDAAEAGNCFAVGRFTACVFHLMRTTEKCLQELASTLKMSLSLTWDREWQLVINDIRGRLNERYPKHKDPDRIRYEAVLGHLETIKIAWRNTTMHPKKTYTEEEAGELIGAIKSFPRSLAELPG